jgi:Glycosyltransferase family 87
MVWHYLDFFLPAVTARQHIPSGVHQRPYFGIDLYPYWLGTRELFGSHLSPYTDEIAHRTQTELYGRPIDPALPGDPKDQHRFSYPVFVVFFIAPLARLPFHVVRIIGLIIWCVLAMIGFLLWAKVFAPRMSTAWTIAGLLLSFTSYPSLEAIFAEQMSVVVAALLAGMFFSLSKDHLKIAGMLFAVATLKPQLILLPAFALFCWTLGDWKHRNLFLRSALITFGVLLIASEVVLPGWIFQWWHTVIAYRGYTLPPLAKYLMGPVIGGIISVSLVLGASLISLRFRRADAGSNEFLLTFSLVLCVTLIVFPSADAVYDHVLLIPVALMILQSPPDLLPAKRIIHIVRTIGYAAIAWPWIAATLVVLFSSVSRLDLHTPFYGLLPIRTATSVPFILLAFIILRLKHTGVDYFKRTPKASATS